MGFLLYRASRPASALLLVQVSIIDDGLREVVQAAELLVRQVSGPVAPLPLVSGDRNMLAVDKEMLLVVHLDHAYLVSLVDNRIPGHRTPPCPANVSPGISPVRT